MGAREPPNIIQYRLKDEIIGYIFCAERHAGGHIVRTELFAADLIFLTADVAVDHIFDAMDCSTDDVFGAIRRADGHIPHAPDGSSQDVTVGDVVHKLISPLACAAGYVGRAVGHTSNEVTSAAAFAADDVCNFMIHPTDDVARAAIHAADRVLHALGNIIINIHQTLPPGIQDVLSCKESGSRNGVMRIYESACAVQD